MTTIDRPPRQVESPTAPAGAQDTWHLDAVFFLSVYLVLLVGLQSQLVIGPLGGAGNPALLVGAAGFVWWVLYQVQRPRRTGRGRQPVRIALFAVAAAFLCSFVAAMIRPINTAEASTAQLGLVTLVSWLGVGLLTTDGLPDRKAFDTLVRRLVVVAGLLALLGLAQFVTHRPLMRGLDIPGLSQNFPSGGIASRDGFTRPAGTAIHPIEYGAVLTAVLPLAITLARSASRQGRHLWWFWVTCMGMGIVVSISRSALVCSFVGLVLLASVWTPRARRALAAAVVVMVGVVGVAVPGLVGTLRGLFSGAGQDNSVASRTGSYDIATEFIHRSPFFGRGFSTFLPSYRIFDNEYLLLAVEVGLVGVVCVLALLLTAMRAAWRGRALACDDGTREMGQALFAGVAAAACGLALFDGLSFPTSTGVLFLLLGLCGAFQRIVTDERKELEKATVARE